MGKDAKRDSGENVEEWVESQLQRLDRLVELREEACAHIFEQIKHEKINEQINPTNQARLERKKAKAEKVLAKQAAEESGVDLERQNNLTYTIEETEKWRIKLEEKASNQDPGHVDYGQLSRRKYEKLTEKLQPLAIQRRSKEDAILAMSEEVTQMQADRAKFSRRRRFDESEDITYINERNARFNRKAARAYNEFTEELRESIERGTA